MNEKTVSTRQLLAALWMKKWLIILCVVLCGALALMVTAVFVAPKYETSVVFYLDGQNPQSLVESGIYILHTRQTLDAILDHAGVDCSRSQLEGMLQAKAMGETDLLEVQVTCEQPQTAKALADAIAEILPQRVAAVMDGTTIKLADVPELPAEPSSPGYAIHLLIGAFLGLLLPVGIVVIREYWKARL